GRVFQVVFDDDFAVANAFAGNAAQPFAADRVGFAPHADVSQHLMGIGDRHRVGADVLADDIANGGQRFAVDVAEIGQRLVGDIQRQLGLACGDHFFFIFDAL